MMKKILAIVLFFTLVSCEQQTEKPTIVVDAYPLEYIVDNIVGSDVEVINIQDYDNVKDKLEVSANAKLVLYVGNAYSGDIKNISNSVNIYDKIFSKYNSEFFWISPNYMLKASEVIYQEIINTFPNNKEVFLENYNEFEEQLQEMNSEFDRTLSKYENEGVQTNKNAFEYYNDYYIDVDTVKNFAELEIVIAPSYDNHEGTMFSYIQCDDCTEDAVEMIQLNLIDVKPEAGNYLSEQYKNLLKLNRLLE